MNRIINQIVKPEDLVKTVRLAGGDINEVYYVETTKDRFCLKVNKKNEYPQMFEREANGLSLLSETKSFRIPSVHEHGESQDIQYLKL